MENLLFKESYCHADKRNNTELMGRCRKLEEYAVFTGYVRENLNTLEPSAAIHEAIERCIEEGVLAEFLSRRRAVVMNALLEEYDEERVMKSLSKEFYEDGYEDGIVKGKEQGREEGRLAGLKEGLRIFVMDNMEEGISKDRIIEKIERSLKLMKEEAEE